MLIKELPVLGKGLRALCLQVKPLADINVTGRGSRNVIEEQKYFECSLLQSRREMVIDYWLAFSVEKLKCDSNHFHFNYNTKFNRSISGQEDLVAYSIKRNMNLRYWRQLLIGGKHADLYIPEIHICLEPASPRHNSNAKRSRISEYADNDRIKMNDLQSVDIETYNARFFYPLMDGLCRERLLSKERQLDNLFKIAMQTLPRFIHHKELIGMIQQLDIAIDKTKKNKNINQQLQ